MPKIPTFQAEGSIEQLQGTTTNIQMGLNQTIGSALKLSLIHISEPTRPY